MTVKDIRAIIEEAPDDTEVKIFYYAKDKVDWKKLRFFWLPLLYLDEESKQKLLIRLQDE